MNFFYYIYFNLYNFYFKDGKQDGNPNTPWFRATSSFAICLTFWCFLAYAIYEHTKYQTFQLNSKIPLLLIFTTIIFYFLFHSIFVKNKQYEKIYLKFKHYDVKYKIIGRVCSWVFIFLPVLLFLFYSLLIHKKI
jgi:hypothetical protein